jgi:hypothetical protein
MLVIGVFTALAIRVTTVSPRVAISPPKFVVNLEMSGNSARSVVSESCAMTVRLMPPRLFDIIYKKFV